MYFYSFQYLDAQCWYSDDAISNVHTIEYVSIERNNCAVISTHRVNYAHLDEEWCARGRVELGALLARLAADRAVFVTDLELRDLTVRGFSVRPVPGGAPIERRLTASGMVELARS